MYVSYKGSKILTPIVADLFSDWGISPEQAFSSIPYYKISNNSKYDLWRYHIESISVLVNAAILVSEVKTS